MKVVIQRVNQASVVVDGETVGEIQKGVLALLGVMKGDSEENADYLAKKLAEFRLFKDEQDRMNRSLQDVQGEVLLVSQFTLAADGRKGRRPSFDLAAPPEEANKLYTYFADILRNKYQLGVQSGIFGAYMKVFLENDGPVTFVLDHPFSNEKNK